MGWGNQDLYRWNGSVSVEGGSIAGYNTYFRGRSVLAPSANETYDENSINDIETFSQQISGKELIWRCDTTGNKSTLHPSTSSIVIKVQGDLDTKVTFRLNGTSYTAAIRELLHYGYTNHMEYYHSQAFKIYKAVPESRYTFHLNLEDNVPENKCDVYHLEAAQKNRQWAYVSPIYVNQE